MATNDNRVSYDRMNETNQEIKCAESIIGLGLETLMQTKIISSYLLPLKIATAAMTTTPTIPTVSAKV
jgi:hypothetical protein